MVHCSLVLFDLDGTLLDTLDDLAEAVNHALALRGLPQHDREGVRVRKTAPTRCNYGRIRKALSLEVI